MAGQPYGAKECSAGAVWAGIRATSARFPLNAARSCISAHIRSYPFISVYIGLYLAHICTYRCQWSRRRRGRPGVWTRRLPTAKSDAVIVGVARRRITEVIAKVW